MSLLASSSNNMRFSILVFVLLFFVFTITIHGGEEITNQMRQELFNQPPSAKVEFVTTKGTMIIAVHHNWSPRGADHFLELVKDGFYYDNAFYRCVEGFLTQFGLSDKKDKKHWHYEEIEDDPNLHLGIEKHFISFAGGGPNTRSSQLFIAFEFLDFLGNEPWETPFGEVIEGQEVLDKLYKGYGEMTPFNERGIDQQKIQTYGNHYVRKNFPETDFLISSRIIEINGEAVTATTETIHDNTDGEL